MVVWDGNSEYGSKLAGGVYIYRMLVRNELGHTSGKSGKLIMLN
jgi:hypothetical protein